MSLEVIKNDAKELTPGEKSILNKIKSLYKDYKGDAYLYIQPTIGSLVPDFILIDEQRGLSILEVKDWSMGYISSINKRKVQLADREDDNPVLKTRKYLDITNGIISTSNDDMEFIEDNIYANTVLTNISSSEIVDLKLNKEFYQKPINSITSDLLRKLSIDDLFSDEYISIDESDMVLLRTLLFPETRIKKVKADISGKVIEETINALDIEQENFARRLPYGHYMVTGVPGSGKTVILIARAIHLAKENPDWKIKILTYNKSLSAKIDSILSSIAEEIKYNNFLNDIPIQNIDVVHFHKLATNIANVRNAEGDLDDWFNNKLPLKALEKAKPIYDAVLIDEYQDFRDDWIRVCIKLCKEHTYINNSNKEVKGINLFLAGDRLQSIYNSKVHNWNKDFGLNMAGRSKLLKTSYRAGKDNTVLALKFLQTYEPLEEEVNKFYKEENEVNLSLNDAGNSSCVEFLEGGYECISDTVNKLLNTGYSYNDILIINHSWDKDYDNNTVSSSLNPNVKCNTKAVKDATPNELRTCLLTSTYQSSKGLEAKVVILVDIDKFKGRVKVDDDIIQRKLLYVGMTRASQKLYLHSKNFNIDSFGKQIKEIYDNTLALV
ncbi:MAG: UvrD-helicase domain-containing protein [Paraclostridium sp.]